MDHLYLILVVFSICSSILYWQYTTIKTLRAEQRKMQEEEDAEETHDNSEEEKIKGIYAEIERLKAERERINAMSTIVLAQSTLSNITLQTLTEDVIPAMKILGTTPVNLDEIIDYINRVPMGSSRPKTDYYASLTLIEPGGSEEGEDNQASESQASSVPNDFSKFNRMKVNGGSTPFVVHRWIPDDARMEKLVCDKLFGGNRDRMESVLLFGSELRANALMLLHNTSHRVGKINVPEMGYQNLFSEIVQGIFNHGNIPFDVMSVNQMKLTAKLNIQSEDDPGTYANSTLGGYADLGFFRKSSALPLKPQHMVVCGEKKKNLRKMTAYQQKDQLLIEMMACRQMSHPRRRYVKGFLSDIYALNIAVQDENRDFYVAPRECHHRPYFIRLFYLLCELTDKEFNETVLKHVIDLPIEVQGVHKKKYSLKRSATNKQSNCNKKKKKLCGKKKTMNSISENFIDFKAGDEQEYFDEIFREQMIMSYHRCGREYLCEEALLRLGCK